MLHSKEWAITPNGRELVVGSSGMVYWKAIGKSRYINAAIKSGSTGKDSK